MPRFLDKGDKTFWRATHEAINEFTDSMLPDISKPTVGADCLTDNKVHHGTTSKNANSGNQACHKGCNPPYCNHEKYHIYL